MEISEEQFKAAEEIVAAYKAQQNTCYVIKSFPNKEEITKVAHAHALLESQAARAVACCYFKEGAKWIMEEIKKRGAIIRKEESDEKISTNKNIKYFYYTEKNAWVKLDRRTGSLKMLTQAETLVMLRNTIAGHWLANDKFEERTDFRTWITNEACV